MLSLLKRIKHKLSVEDSLKIISHPQFKKSACRYVNIFLVGIITLTPSICIHVYAQETPIAQTEAELNNTFGFEKLKALNHLTKYYLQGNERKALRYGRQAVSLGENLFFKSDTPYDANERPHMLQAYVQLGKVLFEREDYFESQKHFEAAQSLAIQIENTEYLEDIGSHLGEIQGLVLAGEIKENFFSKNFGDLKVGEIIRGTSNDIAIQTEILSARTNEKKKDFGDAIQHYEKAINLLRNKGDLQQIKELQLKVAFLFDSLDRHREAQEFLREAIIEIEDIEPLDFAMDSLQSVPEVQYAPSASERIQQKNFIEISKSYAERKDYQKSLAYYKLYQELSQKMIEDSLGKAAESMRKESEILLLKQQKKIADLNVKALEKEKEKQIQLRNTAIVVTLLILMSAVVTLYFYSTKKKEHKKLTIAYRDLDKTKNKLVGAEQKIVKLLRQHVSGDVAMELLMNNSDKPGERLFVCIMFLDIRDFTPMAEKLSPEEIIEYQNNVFGFMIDIVQKHNGNINQLLGDGFMATFGAPISRGNDCQNALLAAQEILQEVKERNEAEIIPKTKIGIGLHAGYVVTGNVGNEARKQYSVTGNPVIIASRVEQLNKTYKSKLIITEEVYKKLEQPIQLKQPFLEVEVKGRSHPVKILKMA